MTTPATQSHAVHAITFLSDMDSHGIYTADKLNELPAPLREVVPTFTEDETAAAMEARGLGGELERRGGRVIYGWTTASALCRAITGDSPGSNYHGRGTAFRADVGALKLAADGKTQTASPVSQ